MLPQVTTLSGLDHYSPLGSFIYLLFAFNPLMIGPFALTLDERQWFDRSTFFFSAHSSQLGCVSQRIADFSALCIFLLCDVRPRAGNRVQFCLEWLRVRLRHRIATSDLEPAITYSYV